MYVQVLINFQNQKADHNRHKKIIRVSIIRIAKSFAPGNNLPLPASLGVNLADCLAFLLLLPVRRNRLFYLPSPAFPREKIWVSASIGKRKQTSNPESAFRELSLPGWPQNALAIIAMTTNLSNKNERTPLSAGCVHCCKSSLLLSYRRLRVKDWLPGRTWQVRWC